MTILVPAPGCWSGTGTYNTHWHWHARPTRKMPACGTRDPSATSHCSCRPSPRASVLRTAAAAAAAATAATSAFAAAVAAAAAA